MQKTLQDNLRQQNYYLFMLPLFFVLHGYMEFYNLISLKDAAKLLLHYIVATTAVLFFTKWLLKSYTKASLFSMTLLSVFFFFGAFQDFINTRFHGSFVTQYSFLLPAITIMLVSVYLVLKRSNCNMEKVKIYLNVLLLLLLIVDASFLIAKMAERKKQFSKIASSISVGNDCERPDFFLIIADGYSGNHSLRKYFNYDNKKFENQLQESGFYIFDSSFANYNYTIYSVGSLLNMNYLNISNYYNNSRSLSIGFDALRNNQLLQVLEKLGYQFYNYSIFDIGKYPAAKKISHLELGDNLLTTQTLFYRLKQDIGYHLISTLKLKFLERKIQKDPFEIMATNNRIDSLTRAGIKLPNTKPRFMYIHLLMPHNPYYYDSAGILTSEKIFTSQHNANRNKYVSYLKYTNQKLTELIQLIQENTQNKSIIVLASDHGCRECIASEPKKGFDELQNILAVYLPARNYRSFYKGMTAVNLFRSILNIQYNTRLPLLKDSVILMQEEK